MALGQIIDDNYSTLLSCLAPTNELLGRLRSISSAKDRIPFIKQQETRTRRDVPRDRQDSVTNGFIAALKACGQEHVANIFRRESDKVPMSDEHRKMLIKQNAELCKFLDPENGLLNKLASLETVAKLTISYFTIQRAACTISANV